MTKYIATDTEATGLVWSGTPKERGFHPARPFAFSFCDERGSTTYVRWEVNPKNRQVVMPPPRHGDWRILRDVMEDPAYTKIFHNRTYDQRMYQLIGVPLKGVAEDTLALAHVATGGAEISYGLKPLGDRYLQIGTEDEKALKDAVNAARRAAKGKGWCIADPTTRLFGREAWKADMWLPIPPVPKLCEEYAIQDAVRTMLLWECFWPLVESTPGMLETYEREMNLMPYIYRMENRGVRVFPENVEFEIKRYSRLAKRYKQNIDKEVGHDLNIRSHKQMTKLFYDERGHRKRRNDRGGVTLNQITLGEIARGTAEEEPDPLAMDIMNYRACLNAISLFLEPYERHMHVEDDEWVIHTNIRQIGPVTGRMAASDPNMMNVASEETSLSHADQKMRPRECFGPREGYIWYLPDYSQIEVWMFAFIGDCKVMQKALLSGRDFHDQINQRVFAKRVDFKQNFEHYRKRSKMIQFLKFYGGGDKKLALTLREPYEVAVGFRKDYDSRMPEVSQYMDRLIKQVRRTGFLVSPYGRHYFLEPRFAYRCVNYNTQGPASDCFKEGLIEVQEMLDDDWQGTEILLPLHDEIIIEVPLEYHSKELMRDIARAMQIPGRKVGIPELKVDFKVARTRWSRYQKVSYR